MLVLISKYLVVRVSNQCVCNTFTVDIPKLDMKEAEKTQTPTVYTALNSENSVSFILVFS